jgi:general secretion pathway protein H
VRNIKGFTLIELLIVIVLIGIMTTMTMLSIGTGNQRDWQRQEAERLVQLLKMASQEAIIRGMPIALECHQRGYRFMSINNGEWRTEVEDAIFKPRTLQPQLFIDLTIDKETVLLSAQEALKPDPQIVFTPDGDMNLFQIKIRLTDSDETFTVTNTPKDGLVMSTQTAESAL